MSAPEAARKILRFFQSDFPAVSGIKIILRKIVRTACDFFARTIFLPAASENRLG